MIGLSKPKTWSEAALGDIAEIERTSVTAENIVSGTKYVGLENLDGEGGITSVQTVSNGDLASNKFMFGPEHILYGKLRPYLRKIVRPDFDGVCSTDILPIRPTKVDRGFLFYFLRHPRVVEFATGRCEGANLPRISPSAIEKFPIHFPPLPEQRRIADILDKADAIRQKRSESILLSSDLLYSAFVDRFGDTLTNNRQWEIVPLGSLIADGPQNGIYKPSSAYGKGVPIIRIDTFQNGEFVLSANITKRVQLDEAETKLYQLRNQDLIINRVNSRTHLGKTAFVDYLTEPTVFESNMMRITLNYQRVNPHFLLQLFQSMSVKKQIQEAAKEAVNQASINQTDVKALQIPLPPLPLQRQFADFVAATSRFKTGCQASLDRQNTLFDSLVQRAFRGEL